MNSTTSLLLRRRGLLATVSIAALLAAIGAPACAETRLVQVDVVDRDSGECLHVWHDHGRPVVAGRPGARYAVRLVNNTGQRVLAVVAIDGVNVVTGETASAGQRGYVLDPWQRTEITGWRKSNSEVAAFEFTALRDSYAARTGRPDDVGVIGVAAFREAPQVAVLESPAPPVVERPRLDGLAKSAQEAGSGRDAAGADAPRSAAPTARAVAPQPSERLGTGHGERETSVVQTTTFERATSQPAQTVAIRYDSLDNLVAAGIVPPPRVASTSPRPFPADPSPGYVPDPPRR